MRIQAALMISALLFPFGGELSAHGRHFLFSGGKGTSFFGVHFGHAGGGFFHFRGPFFRHRGAHVIVQPFFLVPGAGSHLLQQTSAGPFLFHGYGSGAVIASSARLRSSSFVEEWKEKDPLAGQAGSGLEESLVLEEGMAPEEVMQRLGSPLRRLRLGEREVWVYSGYSLVFEGGRLRELR